MSGGRITRTSGPVTINLSGGKQDVPQPSKLFDVEEFPENQQPGNV